MPWFQAKPASTEWGWHWTMGRVDPDKGQIASHYRPLLGAYDSGDPHVLEAHVLWMRLSGAKAVILDWYGIEDALDYGMIHRNVQRLVPWLKKAGLRFAICYEDQTLPKLKALGRIQSEAGHAKAVVDWLALHWFSDPSYLRHEGKPLFLVFGPQALKGEQWPEVLGRRDLSVFGVAGPHRFGNGGFAWPDPNGKADDEHGLKGFYARAKGKPFVAGAFPGFHGFYKEGGQPERFGVVPRSLDRYRRTLRIARESGSPLIQIVTWNDWGEGTQIEPGEDYGYAYLEATQDFAKEVEPAFRPDRQALRDVLRLYRLRRSGSSAEAERLSARLFALGST